MKIKTNRNSSLFHICDLSPQEIIKIQNSLARTELGAKLLEAMESRFPASADDGPQRTTQNA